jgi:hypothetical protein
MLSQRAVERPANELRRRFDPKRADVVVVGARSC